MGNKSTGRNSDGGTQRLSGLGRAWTLNPHSLGGGVEAADAYAMSRRISRSFTEDRGPQVGVASWE